MRNMRSHIFSSDIMDRRYNVIYEEYIPMYDYYLLKTFVGYALSQKQFSAECHCAVSSLSLAIVHRRLTPGYSPVQ